MNRLMSRKCSSRDISLMNTRNKSGPSIDPLGNPDLFFNGSDFVPFIFTNCSLLLRQKPLYLNSVHMYILRFKIKIS